MWSVDTGNEFGHLTRHCEMDKTYTFILGIVTAFALCKYSRAEWNTTRVSGNITVSCNHHDNSSNCTDVKDDHTWSGHFSECPTNYKHYCINGVCRFVKEQNTPSCRCESGHIGSRCEYREFIYQDRDKIVIACVVAGLVILILFIVFICICTNKRYNPCRKKKRKNKTADEIEKLSSLSSNEAASAAAAETRDSNVVWINHWRAPARVGDFLDCSVKISSGKDESSALQQSSLCRSVCCCVPHSSHHSCLAG